jgi:UDP-N-acetylmuramyl pentapeptide synthase
MSRTNQEIRSGSRAVCRGFPGCSPNRAKQPLSDGFEAQERHRNLSQRLWGVVLVLAKWRTALSGLVRQGRRKIVKPLKRLYRETLAASKQSSLWWRARQRRFTRSHVTYVGVTGSCGKTTTTRLIGAVLSSAGECRVDAGRNGERRVIANLLTVGPNTKFCIQELSGSRPGRIRRQASVLKPQIGVITTVGGDHYKNFRTLEATAEEKGQLVASLPADGTAILNADDPHVRAMAARTRAHVITYGLDPGADVRARDVRSTWPERLSLTVMHGGRELHLQTRLLGEYWVTSILAAIACGLARGIDLETCAKAIAACEPVFGRSSVHSLPDGPDHVLETQKAPLWTIANSMAFMRTARAKRKTMVFGTVSDYSGKGGETPPQGRAASARGRGPGDFRRPAGEPCREAAARRDQRQAHRVRDQLSGRGLLGVDFRRRRTHLHQGLDHRSSRAAYARSIR